MITKKHNELINKAVEYFLNNPDESYTSVAKKFGVNRQTISSRIKNAPDRRKKAVNSNYFEKIDTEEKAYWLGFFEADGCIKADGTIQLSLCIEDCKHVEKFKQAIESDHDIKLENNSFGNKASKLAVIRFGDKKMVQDLNNLGVYRNKTLKEKPPVDLREDLVKPYIRGLIDGDGWFSTSIDNRRGYTNYELGLGSSEEMLEWVVKQLSTHINIKPRKITEYKTIHRVRYSGKDVLKILDWLYKDSTIYLDRKYEKYRLLPSQDKTMRSPERISAELSEDGVKPKGSLLETEGTDKVN